MLCRTEIIHTKIKGSKTFPKFCSDFQQAHNSAKNGGRRRLVLTISKNKNGLYFYKLIGSALTAYSINFEQAPTSSGPRVGCETSSKRGRGLAVTVRYFKKPNV